MPQASFDAVCEQMIAHSKPAGHAPRQGALSGNRSGFPVSWLELVEPPGASAQRADVKGGPG
ncbi:hypothetical protein [Streptomyces sp. SM11]|uniref:hypothetical protein n=1 Tax=Streptomyces sp. SM11 TaxID=565557 RepID=UPI0011AFD694|nr:hypothetical protein [Streptomyces sp. SM11]